MRKEEGRTEAQVEKKNKCDVCKERTVAVTAVAVAKAINSSTTTAAAAASEVT